MKAQTHTLRGKLDTDGMKEFFTPLRENATKPAVKRIENVLTLLVAADTQAREQREQKRILERSGQDFHRSKFFMESLDESARTCGLLNAALLRYPTLPLAQGGIGRFEIIDRPVTSSTGRWAYWERVSVGRLLNLARKPGELSRLRRCLECQQWFYAIRGHQQFCGVSCRRRHTAQDPEFKEKRARYMREIYRPIIQPETESRSRRQAARVLSGNSKKKGGNRPIH
jgi:hypothetical protein